MPFVQVDLHRALADRLKPEISEQIHAALVEAIDMDPTDKFQIFRPHDEGELVFDHGYNGVDRQDLVYIQILMVHMYDVGSKRRLFDTIARKLESIGIRHEDVLIAVVENGFEDWYAGKFYAEPATTAAAS